MRKDSRKPMQTQRVHRVASSTTSAVHRVTPSTTIAVHRGTRSTTIAVAIATVVGCKGEPKPAAPATGPVYTPLMANTVRGFAPDCQTTKQPGAEVVEVVTCLGPNGSATMSLGAADKLRRVDIKMRSMFRSSARTHLGFVIPPVAGQEMADKLLAAVDRLALGQSEVANATGARAELSAGGTVKTMPEFSVVLTW